MRSPKQRSGFTLMELMVVMGLMLLLATIFISNYFGMTRAASYTAAETDVYNLLQLARQRACMDGSKVFFMLLNSNSYVLVQGVGTITRNMEKGSASGSAGSYFTFYDDYSDHPPSNIDKSGLRVWNMDVNSYGENVKITVDERLDVLYEGTTAKCKRPYTAIETELAKASDYKEWKAGRRYGFEIHPRQTLPKGFYFGIESPDKAPDNDKIVFAADGSSSFINADGSESHNGTTSIYIYEKIVKDRVHPIEIKVANPAGTITPYTKHLGGQ